MREKKQKRIWLTAVIAVVAAAILISTSVTGAIAKNIIGKKKIAIFGIPTTEDSVNEKMLKTHMYNATHNRVKWLYDLMTASGIRDLSNGSNGRLVYQKAFQHGLIDEYDEKDMLLPLNRLFVAQTMVRALQYPERSVGQIVDITPAQKSLATMAYFGYFLPDDDDMIYPEEQITAEEYEMLLTELGRYRVLSGRTILAFGDSIMHGSGNDDEGIADLIGEKYGMTVRDYSVPGASFADRGQRSRIANQIRVAYTNGEKADIILLNGGTNDMERTAFGEFGEGFDMSKADETTFTGGFEKALWLIRNRWQDVPTVYIRVHNMDLVSDKEEKKYGERAMEIADKWNIASVDLYNGTGMNTEIQALCDRYTYAEDLSDGKHDSIHPNAFGYAKYYLPMIGKTVYNCFAD